ncbi:MAG: hypothetical protein ACOYNJ_03570 [Candidatus Nanopelagicales bacterium]
MPVAWILTACHPRSVYLARQWEQNAVFRWAPDGFELIGVLMEGHERHGWRWIS